MSCMRTEEAGAAWNMFCSSRIYVVRSRSPLLRVALCLRARSHVEVAEISYRRIIEGQRPDGPRV